MIFFNKKFLTVSVVSTILSFGLFYFAICPLYKMADNGSKELFNLKKLASQAGGRIEEEVKMEEAEQALNKGTEKINGVFVNSEIPVEFIKFLENTAEENDLLIDISPVSFKKEKDEIWTPMGFQVDLLGTFSGCRAFLEKAEYGSYALELDNLTVQKITDRKPFLEKFPNLPAEAVSMSLIIKIFSK
jgi:hypothetical protein